MPCSGSRQFADAAEFQANFRNGRIDLVFFRPGPFKARLNWVELPHLHLMRTAESLPRIAYMSLPAGRALIAFPDGFASPPTGGGAQLQPGDILFHSLGARMHVRTDCAGQWGFISLTPEQLAGCGKALTGLDIVPPLASRVLRPSAAAATRLMLLHAKASRLAESNPDMFAHREAARALEQELLHALVTCLTAAAAADDARARLRHAQIMTRFEEVVAAHLDQPVDMAKLRVILGVPERTLRLCCAQFLGMGPSRYLRLRRLNLAHVELRRATPAAASVAEIARRHQFAELGRFAASYTRVFGEPPSATLRRARSRAMEKLGNPPSSN